MPVFLTAPKDLQRTPDYDELLRACLVSNRVGLGGVKSASFTRRTTSCELFLRGSFLSFSKRCFQRELSDRSSAYARERHKRGNPHLYQTGSNSHRIARPLGVVMVVGGVVLVG